MANDTELLTGIKDPVYGYSIGDTGNLNKPYADIAPLSSPDYKLSCPPSMEIQIRNLKNALESWREIVVRIHSVLLWEKQWHPTAIVGATTTLFMLIWLTDPSVLSILSLLGLAVTIADYLVPSIAASVFKTDLWTTQKQKKYDDICTDVILYKTKSELLVNSYCNMRNTNPKLYFSFTIFVLGLLSWIGCTINNIFLSYVAVTFILLLPGMEHCGILNKCTVHMSKIFNDLVTNAKSKVNTKKTQ